MMRSQGARQHITLLGLTTIASTGQLTFTARPFNHRPGYGVKLPCLIPIRLWKIAPMKTIRLTGKYADKVAFVDDEDYEMVSAHRWGLGGHGYATTSTPKSRMVYMHRLIAGTPVGMETDHLNRNKLDNRRSNLKICTRAENMLNRGPQRRRGQLTRGWVRRIRVKDNEYYMGVFKYQRKKYQTTTCSTREQAEGALKQLLVDMRLYPFKEEP